MPEISVIVPVYKAEAYLADCIDSILNQSFQDLEIILVNDGSPDGCGAICDGYAAREERVHALHQENQGQAAARNHAMKIARGSWICFVDSDDLIHPQMLSVLYEAIREHGVGISMCQMLEATALPEDFGRPRAPVFETFAMDERTLVSLFDEGAYPAWVSCAKLIRRDLVEGYPFQPGRVYEDNEAVCRWVVEGKTIAITQEQLYFYRTNPVSTTQSTFSLKKLDYLWALESIIHYYHSLGFAVLTERFCDLYAEAAAGCWYRTRQELNRKDVARDIRKRMLRLFGRGGIPMTKNQLETILGVMHPNWMGVYWPAEAVYRTVKENGVLGAGKKIWSQLRKGAKE